MKMGIAVYDLTMYVWNLVLIWITIMLGLSQSSQNGSMSTVPCKEGWYFFGEKCYGSPTGFMSKLSWEDARQICLRENGDLATVYSKDLQEFLTAFVLTQIKSESSRLWIGLKGSEYDVWNDGTPVNYTFWGTDEPKPPISSLDCVGMYLKNFQDKGGWGNWFCGLKNSYLCQAEKDTSLSNPDPRFCSIEENGGWKHLNSCYHIVEEKLAWEEAEYYCQEVYGGHLLSILDLAAQTYVNYILSDQSMEFWIGIQMKNQSLQRWSSGWAVAFTIWDDEHKNILDGTCALMTKKGTWSSAPCDTQHPFVCESSEDPLYPTLKQAPTGWICPTTSDDWIDLGGDTCYIFETSMQLSWFEANFHCHKKGGNLASIHSDKETKILHPHVIIHNSSILKIIHIGLHRNLHDNKIFEWADGSALDYENWWEGSQPTHEKYKCGALWNDDMKWIDEPCGMIYAPSGFICSARKVPPNSDEENQTQCRTSVSVRRDSSNIKGEISLNNVIGISALVLVLCFFMGIAICYYKKLSIPGFRRLELES